MLRECTCLTILVFASISMCPRNKRLTIKSNIVKFLVLVKLRYGMVRFGMVWFVRVSGGMFGNVLEYSRMFRATQKSFIGGGLWLVHSNYSVYSVLTSRPSDSEIEIELERT